MRTYPAKRQTRKQKQFRRKLQEVERPNRIALVETLVIARGVALTACDQCPFRVGSSYAYDSDAMAALDSGYDPSCHKLVGTQAIFHEAFPTTNRCRGHDAWVMGQEGYDKPRQL